MREAMSVETATIESNALFGLDALLLCPVTVTAPLETITTPELVTAPEVATAPPPALPEKE